jgi:hypothetical protein
MTAPRTRADEVLGSAVSVPDHVVYREFPAEVVFLNLETGQYHGLNPTAGRMLHALQEQATVARAIDELTAQLGQPRERIEHDMLDLLLALQERGLVIIGSSTNDEDVS